MDYVHEMINRNAKEVANKQIARELTIGAKQLLTLLIVGTVVIVTFALLVRIFVMTG